MSKKYNLIFVALDYILLLLFFYIADKESNIILAVFAGSILIRNEIRYSVSKLKEVQNER